MNAMIRRRLATLEAAVMVIPAKRCDRCGFEHARKVTIGEVRRMVRVMGGTRLPSPLPGTSWPGPFCLCACCSSYRGLAEVTYGLPMRGSG